MLQVPILETDPEAGTVAYRNEAGSWSSSRSWTARPSCSGAPDWAMRWAALGVDYEMSGKDLIDSVKVSSQICRILGGMPPEGFSYELFLDEQGQKISKSKGNGLTVDQWLTYGTRESLKLYMFQAPRKAKRLYFDVIPRHVDDYFGLLERYQEQDQEQRYHNPVWHIHDGEPPQYRLPISFTMLLNLASVVNAEAPAVLWAFIHRYAPEATPENSPVLDELVQRALAYYRDFVKPSKAYRPPDENERAALSEFARLARGLRGRGAGRSRRGDPTGGVRDRQAPRLRRQSAALVPGALRDPARPERGAALWHLRRVLRAGRDRGPDPPRPGRPAARPAGSLT